MSAKTVVLALASSALVAVPALAFAQAMPSAPIPYSQLASDNAKMAKKPDHHARHMAHKAHHEAAMAQKNADTAAGDQTQVATNQAKAGGTSAKASDHHAHKMAKMAKSEADKASKSASAATPK